MEKGTLSDLEGKVGDEVGHGAGKARVNPELRGASAGRALDGAASACGS